MKVVAIVGMAGSGKSLLTGSFVEWLRDQDQDAVAVNLDPGAVSLPYEPDLDVRTYLPDDILVKVDIASMAHALEVRSPFIDHQVMELAAAIPIEHKLRGLSAKVVLRQAVRDLLPERIRHRGKQGFALPIDRWMREDLAEMARDTLLDATARQRGIFRPRAVEQLIERHARGESRGLQLWNLLMLETWFRTFMD